MVVSTMAEQLALLEPQALYAVTQTLPLVASKLTVMEFVPCPVAMVAPEGTVQLYPVAPVTAVML